VRVVRIEAGPHSHQQKKVACPVLITNAMFASSAVLPLPGRAYCSSKRVEVVCKIHVCAVSDSEVDRHR